MECNNLIKAATFSPNSLQFPNAWIGHLPFASWIIQELRPKTFVELGTHSGNSYFAFCQSVLEADIPSKCYAVDTWQGDEHSGLYENDIFARGDAYHQQHYSNFSCLLRMTFDDALHYFADQSIELLHIDGLHTYEAVRHDFEAWLPKLAPGAVIMFHDTNVRERNFGVWKLWEELKAYYPNYLEFIHSHGLGVLQLDNAPKDKQLVWLENNLLEKKYLINYFSALGSRQLERFELTTLKSKISSSHQTITEREHQIIRLNQTVDKHEGQLASLSQTVVEREGQLTNLNQTVAACKGQIANLNQIISVREEHIKELLNSTSWRLTRPLRCISYQAKKTFHTLCIVLGVIRLIPEAITHCGSLSRMLVKLQIIFKRDGFKGIKKRAFLFFYKKGSVVAANYPSKINTALYGENPVVSADFMPKVSIIVPNFNHAQFLPARLDSIFNQTYPNYEVILLDDHSTDNSVTILKDYAARFPSHTTCHFNEKNSGSVFKQWKKGIELVKGELIWIAESDDHCSPNFLEELVRNFQNEAVMLAFCRTDFVSGQPSEKIWSSEEYLSDLNLHCWEYCWIKSAQWLVNNAWAIKNIIPNVSSAIFKHPGHLPLLDDSVWTELKLCGDWVFYLNIARGGLVAYSPYTTNFYRQHFSNTSTAIQQRDIYYQEHEITAKILLTLYKLTPNVLQLQANHLYQHWIRSRGEISQQQFSALYDLERINKEAPQRTPNILMVAYALVAGGGETFPIILANMLKKKGYSVTFANFGQDTTQAEVRNMLSLEIPLLEINNINFSNVLLDDLAIEIVHSHHASVDLALSSLLVNNVGIKQLVTLHGMYETILPHHLKDVLPLLERRVDQFTYTAEKNLQTFSTAFQQQKNFVKINNALAIFAFNPISRCELGINQDDFVLCLVSRAIPEKGWEEAIAAVTIAREKCSRNIHLLLIGNGPEYHRLQLQSKMKFVHFLGFQANIRDYFATADLGFIPSRFMGESFPLVLIDCLHAGRPVLASNIGEIANMLRTNEGWAGELFNLENWQIPVDELGTIIAQLAEDKQRYDLLAQQVPTAAAKFDLEKMVGQYERVYQQLYS
ncbi:hypothetical protein BH10PSE19_BH10PSE19_07870 [soil metagenome]